MAPKLVDSTYYHLWTDALHGSALAHQARNKWDRGTYVRWTVTTAWTAFEMCCGDALNIGGLGNDFKRNLDRATESNHLKPLDWGKGLWQKVNTVYSTRKAYLHVNSNDLELFPEVAEADKAIGTLRDAIKTIYANAGKVPPTWVDDDSDRGWDDGGKFVHSSVIAAGVDRQDPDNIIITYVQNEKEHKSGIYPPSTDPKPLIDALLQNIQGPISAVRVYRGAELLEERQLQIRGA